MRLFGRFFIPVVFVSTIPNFYRTALVLDELNMDSELSYLIFATFYMWFVMVALSWKSWSDWKRDRYNEEYESRYGPRNAVTPNAQRDGE